MVRCYNTLTKEYQMVEVSEAIETEYLRSYWREEQQERRYYKRMSELNEDIDYRNIYKKKIEDVVIEEEEIKILQEHLTRLNDRERKIIECIYYRDMTRTATAKIVGLSGVHIGRLDKKIKLKLKESILQEYDYYV